MCGTGEPSGCSLQAIIGRWFMSNSQMCVWVLKNIHWKTNMTNGLKETRKNFIGCYLSMDVRVSVISCFTSSSLWKALSTQFLICSSVNGVPPEDKLGTFLYIHWYPVIMFMMVSCWWIIKHNEYMKTSQGNILKTCCKQFLHQNYQNHKPCCGALLLYN